jgi:hypothetical protein
LIVYDSIIGQMTILSDFGRFLWAVLRRGQAYITGSLSAAVVFLYEHLAQKMVPGNVVLWGIGVFFVTGAFMAWREQYRSGRPMEIRDRLDELVRIGESLCNKWMNNKHPTWRTKRWIATTRAFAKHHFSIPQYDVFNSEAFDSDEEGAEMFVAIILKLQRREPQSYALAEQVEKMIMGLKRVRKDIRD